MFRKCKYINNKTIYTWTADLLGLKCRLPNVYQIYPLLYLLSIAFFILYLHIYSSAAPSLALDLYLHFHHIYKHYLHTIYTRTLYTITIYICILSTLALSTYYLHWHYVHYLASAGIHLHPHCAQPWPGCVQASVSSSPCLAPRIEDSGSWVCPGTPCPWHSHTYLHYLLWCNYNIYSISLLL